MWKLKASRILFAALILYSPWSLSPRSVVKPIRYDDTMFENGDIILRRGVGIESRAVMAVSGQTLFSHSGLIKKHDGVVEVIHVVVGEPYGSANVTRTEPLSIFLGPERASIAAVYRVRASEYAFASRAVERASTFSFNQVPFDAAFDLKTPDTLYCTELVWRAYKDVGLDLVDGKFETLGTPFGKGDYLLPGTLMKSSHLQLVWSSN